MPFALFPATAMAEIATLFREMSISTLWHCVGTLIHSQLPWDPLQTCSSVNKGIESEHPQGPFGFKFLWFQARGLEQGILNS